MNITFKACNAANYKKGRTAPVKYIVIHYTAGNGDTAKNNADYYASAKIEASAHYFVDEGNIIYQSVKDTDTAWSVGGTRVYKHKECRNANSINIELCSRNRNGSGKPASDGGWYFKPETVNNALELTRFLMSKYNIPPENVIRHFDVWGKICPAPFVNSPGEWESFKRKLVKHMEELTSVNDIVWELKQRGIISETDKWLKKLQSDTDAYWLARKTVKFLRDKRV